jgi:hypothetical protein
MILEGGKRPTRFYQFHPVDHERPSKRRGFQSLVITAWQCFLVVRNSKQDSIHLGDFYFVPSRIGPIPHAPKMIHNALGRRINVGLVISPANDKYPRVQWWVDRTTRGSPVDNDAAAVAVSIRSGGRAIYMAAPWNGLDDTTIVWLLLLLLWW